MSDGAGPFAGRGTRRLAGLAGLLLVAVWPLRTAVFGGQVLFRRDINMIWLPQLEGLLRVAASPAWPLWDPYAGFGRPLLADPRAEALYPLTWLNLLLPPGTYYTVFCVAHLLLAGAGLYLLARAWGCTRLAAWTGGALFAASGPLLSLVSMWHQLAGAAWIPWLFLALERLQRRRRARDGALFGLAFALHVFAGSPDYSALVLPALALYGLWPGEPARPALLRRVGLLGAAVALGLSLAAVQWLPTLAWSRASHRGETPRALRVTWSQPPLALADLLLPTPLALWPLEPGARVQLLGGREPLMPSIYVGLPALALALLGLRARPTGASLGLVGLGATGFALGGFGPFYDVFCALVPPLALLRFPSKAMLLAAFALSGLAALGFDAWARGGRRERLGAALLALLPAALLLGAFWNARLWAQGLLAPVPGTEPHELLGPLVRMAAQTTGLGLGLGLLGLAGGRAPAPGWARLALLAAALGPPLVVNRDLEPTVSPDFYREAPQLLAMFPEREAVRLYVYDYTVLTGVQVAVQPEALRAYELAAVPPGWPPAAALARAVHQYLNPPTAERWGLRGSYDRDILAFEARPHARLIERLHAVADRPGHLRLLQMASVTHVLAIAPAPWWGRLRPVAQLAGVFARPIQVFEVPDPLPRAYAVTGARVRDEDAALDLVSAGDFDPRGEIVLLEGRERAGRGPAGQVRLTESAPDRVRLQADLAQDGFVVLTDAFDAGWRASVDGRPAPVLRANLAFRAVAVPGGRHSVELVYRPASVSAGLLHSLGAAAGCVLALARRAGGRA